MPESLFSAGECDLQGFGSVALGSKNDNTMLLCLIYNKKNKLIIKVQVYKLNPYHVFQLI